MCGSISGAIPFPVSSTSTSTWLFEELKRLETRNRSPGDEA
jgi:hypothetical protein